MLPIVCPRVQVADEQGRAALQPSEERLIRMLIFEGGRMRVKVV
jgi:hypothetical protein